MNDDNVADRVEQGMAAITDLARESARGLFIKLATADSPAPTMDILNSLGIQESTYDATLNGIVAGLVDIIDAAADRSGMEQGPERDALVELRVDISMRMVTAGFAMGAAVNAAVVTGDGFMEELGKRMGMDSHRSHRSHGSDG